MLNEALLAIGPLPIAIGIFLLLATLFKHQQSPLESTMSEKVAQGSKKEALQIPQWISSKVPYIGHVLGYVQDGHGYFAALW